VNRIGKNSLYLMLRRIFVRPNRNLCSQHI